MYIDSIKQGGIIKGISNCASPDVTKKRIIICPVWIMGDNWRGSGVCPTVLVSPVSNISPFTSIYNTINKWLYIYNRDMLPYHKSK